MNEFFREQFNNIHGIVLSDDPTVRQRQLEAHRLDIKYRIIPLLVKGFKDKNPDISWAEAYLRVQKLHIEYMGEFFKGSEATYSIAQHTFVSKQTPVGKFSTVYQRFQQGLAAWREYSFSVQGDGIPLLRLHIHASPVPYGEDNFGLRIEWTKNNFEQLLTRTDNNALTEIRLLTPMATPKKHFTKLSDYDQLLETAIAAEVLNAQKGEPKKDILLFNYGTNVARRFARRLQRLLNTRATTKLFDQVLVQLGQDGLLPALDPLIENVPADANEKITKKLFLSALADQDKQHRATWKQQVAALKAINLAALKDENKKQILKLALEIIEMIQFNRWASDANKHRIQAALVELNALLNRTVALGCNDAKDRAGDQIAMLEARQIANQTGCELNKALVKEVLQKSTPEKVAPDISMPNLARGRDTKGHPEKRSAGIFKRIYTMSQLAEFEAKDRWEARIEHTKERIENGWRILKPIRELILLIQDYFARKNDPLKQVHKISETKVTRALAVVELKRKKFIEKHPEEAAEMVEQHHSAAEVGKRSPSAGRK